MLYIHILVYYGYDMNTEKQFLQEGIDVLTVASNNMPMSEYQDEVDDILNRMQNRMESL